MIPKLFKVTERKQLNPETFTLAAESEDGSPFSFGPGQFNMLYVFGKGEIPISISGEPERTDRVIHTVQDVGAVSHAFCELQPGESFGLRGPFGRGWPVEEAKGRDVLLMAGGLGLAPLRPVLYHVLANRDDYNRVVVLYGARNRERLLFEDELRQWRQRFDLEIMVTLDLANPKWHGRVGVVTSLGRPASQMVDMSEAVAFVCGPHIMMRFSARELLKRGISADRLYISAERNMKCAVGHCGHCQFGPKFLCKDGPVFAYSELSPWLEVREL
jgi:NAD(P)H-flavin reductase